MTDTCERFVGIDVGKAWLDVAVWGSEAVKRFRNDEAGVAELVAWLKEAVPSLVVLEATGGYEQRAAQAMQLAQMAVAVVNPTRVRAFAKALGRLAKTDRIDARLLAEYAGRLQPPAQEARQEREMRIKALVTRREQLVELSTGEQSRLGTAHESIKASIREHLAWMKAQMEALEGQIQDLYATLPEWRDQVELLDSIPGVGLITAISVTAEMPELAQVAPKPAAALAGLAPFNRDSGKHRGKRRIFGGRKGVRRVLYMACLCGIRHNPVIRDFYQRLMEKGKLFKVAITACMRKLLMIMHAMVRDHTTWKNPEPVPAKIAA